MKKLNRELHLAASMNFNLYWSNIAKRYIALPVDSASKFKLELIK